MRDTLDSTSLEARRDVESGQLDGQARLFIARTQTAGVGRFGKAWASPMGGLWCTLAWPINQASRRTAMEGLGLRIGVAVGQHVEHLLATHGHSERVELKWPNDVLVNGKKVAGCLIEVIEKNGRAYALVGVGVNLNFSVDALPVELRSSATTIVDIVEGESPIDRAAQDLCERLRDALMTEGLDSATLAEARQRLHGVGKPARVVMPDGAEKTGALQGLDDRGCLVLQTDAGQFTAPIGAALHN